MDVNEVPKGGEGAYWDQLVQVLGLRWDRMGEERKYVPLSQICQTFLHSMTERIGISSLPHWLVGLRTGLDDYERGLRQR